MKQHEFGIFKYNNGRLAILCNECSVIIKIGKEFNEEEKEAVIGRKTIPFITITNN